MKHPLPAYPSHLCVLRLSALGDVCNLVPTVRALQRQWPDTRITWIVGKGEYSLLAGLSGVEFIVFDKKTGLAGMRAIWRTLKDTRFDVLLHMQQSIRASILSLGLKADVRLGYDSARAKDHQTWFTNRQLAPHPRAHVLESFMDFARALGVEDTELDWNIPIPDDAELEAQSLISGRDALVMSPCANPRLRNFRNWTPEGYAAVIDHAHDAHGLTTFLTGGGSDQEQEMVNAIAHHCRVAQPVSVLGKTSLKGVLALIRQARVVIAPDSGPVHMANALNTPVIGLFATTNPDRAAPYCWQDYVINRYEAAARTYLKKPEQAPWGTRVRHPEAMKLIEADAVNAMLDRLLQDTETHKRPQ
ncbi:glycosyltransferase family 9 protein [Larsenimonas suaedae]|uniref:Glycosyltransferase family 9 protein n=1 Tax=Larsenimonas suaedae TaxID=1851019 RepID=A0ABU1GR82_9GAMM|nr:glycosyltransferase family 9 protein [Larsenimonas suaedae]MCM2972667.1 glycosyltransferase family 9 protein [Larsenimonas suaedae]MDR5894536.1 glycosyltransferase family 9 protein [Larsenimonas suaedae]